MCMVSGLVWGDDPDLWQAWWDDLPSAGDDRSGGSMVSDNLRTDTNCLYRAAAAGSAAREGNGRKESNKEIPIRAGL